MSDTIGRVLREILNYAGTAVFAASGAIVGVRKDFDLWGIVTVGVLTGVGGGIIRDILLGITPPTSVQRWQPVVVAVAACLVVFFFHPAFIQLRRTVLVFDAFGMGLFAATGAQVAVNLHVSVFAASVVGLLTAVGGGLLRDALANEIPMLLQPADLYAVPAILGATAVAVGGRYWPDDQASWLLVGAVLATGLRLVSLWRKWHLPTAPHRR